MGVCGSKPQGCVGVKGKLNLQKHRRNRRARRVTSARHSSNKKRAEPSEISYNNPAFQGNNECWHDPDSVISSDGEDEFYSVQDDVSQAGSISTGVTPRFSNLAINNNNNNNNEFRSSFDEPENEPKNHGLPEKSSAAPQCMTNETAEKDETGLLHNCGFLSNSLLPCLACDESLDGKRKPNGVVGPGSKKRLSITPSFKWRESQENPIASSKPVIHRPIAGSQIRCSPFEKKVPESWSQIEPNTFKVRGQNFHRDKKKEFAANNAAYIPFGVDVFLSPRKIDHIARFVELPSFDSDGEIPSLLVVNLQIPLYPAAIFQNDYDGAGVSFVFYCKLAENYSQDLPGHFRENIKKIIANEVEKIKAFPKDTNAPFRERLKILARVVNVEDLQLSSAERKLMQAYNEKPVLTRPQHEFYLGENYFEIDLDIHRFSYIARKGFESFHDRIKHCIFDFGLTIQGNKAEDLPECMLCCLRLKEIDYANYCQLSC